LGSYLGTFLTFFSVSYGSFDGRKLSALGDEMVRQSEGWWKRQMDENEVARTEYK
jgi:hypothetical protein